MRRSLAIAVLLVLVAGLVSRFLATSGERTVASPPARPLQSEPLVAPADDPLAVAALDEPRHAVEPARPEAEASQAGDASFCAVLGRLVDEEGYGLAGVEVRLQAYRVWAEGIEVARLPGERDLRGWRITSDAGGRFRFDVPVPTAEVTWITIEPDDFHDSARVTFGGEGAEARPALRAGETDLGTLRLATSGAIRGRVLDRAGRPLEGAKLQVGTQRGTTIQRDATTDAYGEFLIGHVPAGAFGVNAEHETHLSEFRTPLTVERRRYTEAGDFLLGDAPTLSGVVVDTVGMPVAGAWLWGWPDSHGAGAGGESAEDGTFTIHLPQDEPYTLGATCDGYGSVSEHDRSRTYAPGTSGIRIVMERAPALSVLVVDASSGAPLEEFGYDVLDDESSFADSHLFTERRRPRFESFAGGRADIAFRIGQDVVLVAAPGHSMETIDLDPSEPLEVPYVLRLERAATVSGLCVEAGMAVAQATVRLEYGLERQGLGREPARFLADRDKVVTLSTGADGAFRFDDVEPGRYRLVALAPSGATRMLATFDVLQGQGLDLGVVELEAPATLTGRVLLPPRRALAGRTVRLDDRFTGPTAITNADGRFRLEGVAPGAHVVGLEEAPGEFDGTEDEPVDLAPGETRDIQLDASALGVGEVRLVILFGGLPRKGLEVSLRAEHGGTGPWRLLGTTSEDGSVRGFAPVAEDHRVKVWSRESGRREHPTARIRARLDGRVDEVVAFEF